MSYAVESSLSSPSGRRAVKSLTIKQLTEAVGHGLTPRMVRHYHQIGLLPTPLRSQSNYRLYSNTDVQQLQRIMALKAQGFQLAHIKQMLKTQPCQQSDNAQLLQLQRQYQQVLQQLVQLRQTAAALEGILGRDHSCQSVQAEALAQLQHLEATTQAEQSLAVDFWQHLDAAVPHHPENFQEALQRLLPDLSQRSEIEVDVLSHLVLACGDISLTAFVRLGATAIQAARESLKAGCRVIVDVPAVTAALDQARLTHLRCPVETLMDNPHIDSVADAEDRFWHHPHWQQRLTERMAGSIVVIGYAPSVLMKLCDQVEAGHPRPALVIGLPIGFSHAPAAKRRLMQLDLPAITIAGGLGGGLLAAVVLNRLAATLITKPDCHCYLSADSTP